MLILPLLSTLELVAVHIHRRDSNVRASFVTKKKDRGLAKVRSKFN